MMKCILIKLDEKEGQAVGESQTVIPFQFSVLVLKAKEKGGRNRE